MHGRLLKLVILIIGTLGSVAGMALVFMSWHVSQDVALATAEHVADVSGSEHAKSDNHAPNQSGHKSKDKNTSHAQDTGSSPASAASAGSSGSAHSSTDTNGHGTKPANKDKAHGVFISLDEVLTNVGTTKPGGRLHSLSIQVDLELFDEQSREVLEKNTAAIKDIVITTGVEQKYEELNTTPGRLYFKELLISRMNERVNQPIVRDVQFVAFYLQ